MYLAIVMGLNLRRMIGWAMGKQMRGQLVKQTLLNCNEPSPTEDRNKISLVIGDVSTLGESPQDIVGMWIYPIQKR